MIPLSHLQPPLLPFQLSCRKAGGIAGDREVYILIRLFLQLFFARRLLATTNLSHPEAESHCTLITGAPSYSFVILKASSRKHKMPQYFMMQFQNFKVKFRHYLRCTTGFKIPSVFLDKSKFKRCLKPRVKI